MKGEYLDLRKCDIKELFFIVKNAEFWDPNKKRKIRYCRIRQTLQKMMKVIKHEKQICLLIGDDDLEL